MKNQSFISLRHEKNFTQERLADSLLVPTTAIRKWERMESMPSVDEMRKMAGLFGVEENEIFVIFRPGKTKTDERQEIESQMYDLLHELFWEISEKEQFLRFCYIAKLANLSGVVTSDNHMFPFTKVYTYDHSHRVALSDRHFNMVVLTMLNIYDVAPVSSDLDVYSFLMTTECPVFPVNGNYDSKDFRQVIKVSFFYR